MDFLYYTHLYYVVMYLFIFVPVARFVRFGYKVCARWLSWREGRWNKTITNENFEGPTTQRNKLFLRKCIISNNITIIRSRNDSNRFSDFQCLLSWILCYVWHESFRLCKTIYRKFAVRPHTWNACGKETWRENLNDGNRVFNDRSSSMLFHRIRIYVQ